MEQAAGGAMGGDCHWALGGMAVFVLMLVAWIKTLLKEIRDADAARISDLKEANASLRHRKKTVEES